MKYIDNTRELTFSGIASIIVVFIAFAGIMMFLASGRLYIGTEHRKEKTIIYSINYKEDENGIFTLGECGVGEDRAYYVYEKDTNNKDVLKGYIADNVPIKDILNKGQESYIEKEYEVSYYTPSLLGKILNPKDMVIYKGKECVSDKDLFPEYTLYLPDGYIKKQIDLSEKK